MCPAAPLDSWLLHSRPSSPQHLRVPPISVSAVRRGHTATGNTSHVPTYLRARLCDHLATIVGLAQLPFQSGSLRHLEPGSLSTMTDMHL